MFAAVQELSICLKDTWEFARLDVPKVIFGSHGPGMTRLCVKTGHSDKWKTALEQGVLLAALWRWRLVVA